MEIDPDTGVLLICSAFLVASLVVMGVIARPRKGERGEGGADRR